MLDIDRIQKFAELPLIVSESKNIVIDFHFTKVCAFGTYFHLCQR